MKYHFIGIKGSGMSALAQIMHDLGNYVQGSDVDHHLFSEDALREKGIKILPFDEDNIKKDMIVVVGNAFDDSNIELKKAKTMNIKIYKYIELLAELVKKYDTLSICGCHGKTTTTALISHILKNTVGTNYLIGDGSGYADSFNKYFVMEACEFKRHFLAFYPNYIILTNIELDHVDYFKDLEDVKDAYMEFLNHAGKYIIACGDDFNIRSLDIDKEIIYYGIDDNNDFVAKNIVLDESGSYFDLFYKNELLDNFYIPYYGKHMVLNSLAAIVFSYLNGVKLEDIKYYISTFKGAKRRFKETIINDIVLIDDYAHHPTEISVTIDAARQKYKDKKIIAVFFENTFSRTQILYKDFANALNKADMAYVTDIFSDREKKEDYEGVSEKLILDLLHNGKNIKISNINNLIDMNKLDMIMGLKNNKNSVIIFMGCKEVYYLKEKLQRVLEEDIK